ncbi:hypothetical protein L7F22_020372 [Adiantum nelumboides]|nr:hypothetical protein [Adiantum nelumboides]
MCDALWGKTPKCVGNVEALHSDVDNLSSSIVDAPPFTLDGCITCLAPCVTFGQLAEILDTGTRSCLMNAIFYMGAACVACPWVYSTQYRTKLRLKFGLPPAPCNDCVVHFFCEPCALCQESRELKARGIDPALGNHLPFHAHLSHLHRPY